MSGRGLKMNVLWCFCGALAIGGSVSTRLEAEPGEEAVVIYNRRTPESKELAFYYAQRRAVPTNQVFGFDLPTTETMSRAEYRDELEKPLRKALEKQRLFIVQAEIKPAQLNRTGDATFKLTNAKIRYVVLCYGVPVKILKDTALSEPGTDKMRIELRRNEAAVDSELAALPLSIQNASLTGPLRNPIYGLTNASLIQPTNGVLMVARLDGPSAEIAHRLVDKAIDAETNGLWGRAYFDLRGLTNSNYKLGDDWIRGAAEIVRRLGFETIVDTRPETFSVSFPMSQIAFYAGWYDGQASGPFTRTNVEFMPGAFAYHLHSFSAATIRSPGQNWVGPLLAKGATATIGYTDEPYLEGTMDVATFFGRFTAFGFTFGEAAYAAQQSLSWQTTVVGDPLYCPFGRKNPADFFGKRLQELHGELLARKSKLIEWSHLQIVNLNLMMNSPASDMTGYLLQEPLTRRSAVLTEKLGDVYYSAGKLGDAIGAYQNALKLDPSPQQRVRIMLTLAPLLVAYTEEQKAFSLYQEFLKEFSDYPALLTIYQKMLPLAKELKHTGDVEKIQKEIARLSPPPPAQ